MIKSKKGHFSMPTWVLILLCIGCLAGVVVDIFVVFNLDSFDSIAVNGRAVYRGTDEYLSAIKIMKSAFVLAGVIEIIIALASGYFVRKRVKSKKRMDEFV